MDEYYDFLSKKCISVQPSGFESKAVNERLFEWQTDIVRWCLRKGKSSIFSDCGSGKTAMQLQFAQEVVEHENAPVLILAPLAVSKQTQREGVKFGIDVNICREQADAIKGINITNYEMLHRFNPAEYKGIVLDESSILKHHDSKTRHALTRAFEPTPYKLCCTATPAPNDFMELGTHSQFMGVMSQTEMLSTFFIHDGGDTSKWRLKGHAESKFFEWVASWACCMTRPQDLGYEQDGYDLPELRVREVVVQSDMADRNGQLMFIAPTAQGLLERRRARRDSMEKRIARAVEIANSTGEQVLIWCDLNDESAGCTASINGAVEVRGSMNAESKEDAMLGFSDGTHRVLVSKPSIAGWGMNWQQCHKMIFVGLSDSFEAYYQAIRRCWRFGQEYPVDVDIIISDAEGAVRANIERKQRDAERMTAELVRYTKEYLRADIRRTARLSEAYATKEIMRIPDWLKGGVA